MVMGRRKRYREVKGKNNKGRKEVVNEEKNKNKNKKNKNKNKKWTGV